MLNALFAFEFLVWISMACVLFTFVGLTGLAVYLLKEYLDQQ
jgi:hypothetical protein